MTDLRYHSRKIYSQRSDSGAATEGEINTGSLQRIADATEIIAGNYVALQNDRDLYKRWYEEKRKEIQKLYNRIKALKGANTKLKRKLGGTACTKL